MIEHEECTQLDGIYKEKCDYDISVTQNIGMGDTTMNMAIRNDNANVFLSAFGTQSASQKVTIAGAVIVTLIIVTMLSLSIIGGVVAAYKIKKLVMARRVQFGKSYDPIKSAELNKPIPRGSIVSILIPKASEYVPPRFT